MQENSLCINVLRNEIFLPPLRANCLGLLGFLEAIGSSQTVPWRGRERQMGLCSLSEVKLPVARQKAAECWTAKVLGEPPELSFDRSVRLAASAGLGRLIR